MSELFDLSKRYAEQKAELNKTTEDIRAFADREGYEEAAYIDDPIHFEVAGMRFTPKRVTGIACATKPEGTPASMPTKLYAGNTKTRSEIIEEGISEGWLNDPQDVPKPSYGNGAAPETD